MTAKIYPSHALIALIAAFFLFYTPTIAQDAIKLEEGETAPHSGYLISKEKFDACLQTTIDLKLTKDLLNAKSELLEVYKKKDAAVKELTEVTDNLTKILGFYKKTTKDLIELKKPSKFNIKWGVYAGVNSMTLDNKIGKGYNLGIFFSF